MNKMKVKEIESNLMACYEIYNTYSWLLNSYVLDFYTEQHWNKLTTNWQKSLGNLEPHQIAKLLNYDKEMNGDVWPLSILALKVLLPRYCLTRKMKNLDIENCPILDNVRVMKLFWKNVKAKKRHEISIMSKVCYESMQKNNCFYIVDVGSGVGHLSRMLNYGYNFKVCAIEAQPLLSNQARNLDVELETWLKRNFQKYQSNRINHINKRIDSDIKSMEFIKIVKEAFNLADYNFQFGIVGLHPCGDLGATLLRLYTECDNAKYINLVGCCYMKLTSSSPYQGFPLSRFCRINNYNLTYHSKEIACHMIENYVEKLNNGENWKLKIHAYRALLEKIIVSLWPDLHHSALCNVKYTEALSFEKYCEKAVGKLNITIPESRFKDYHVNEDIAQWNRVVIFYSLRLLFAPLVETIILLDRDLYVTEAGSSCTIIPAFNCKISPRNHVLSATRN